MSLRLSFNLRPLRLCARCRNDLVRLRVRLCLEVAGELRSRNREARRRTFCACALMRATARAPSSCLILLLFSRSTFCESYELRRVELEWKRTYSSLDLCLESSCRELVHGGRDVALELSVNDSCKRQRSV